MVLPQGRRPIPGYGSTDASSCPRAALWRQARPAFDGRQVIHMHRLIPPRAHDVRQPLGIVLVGLVHLHLKRGNRCLVPECDGAKLPLTRQQEDALWQGFFMASARTTPRVRAELQAAKTSSRALAAQYGINPKTVLKWRKRNITADALMGPKTPKSTVLTPAKEAIVVEFRRRTLLPLDDILGSLRDAIPTLSRSALHRCLQRHGISRLPKTEESQSKRKTFKPTQIGYVHIDSAQLRSVKWCLWHGRWPGCRRKLAALCCWTQHQNLRDVVAGMSWSPEFGHEVKLGLLLRRTDRNDEQTEAVFSGFQGQGCFGGAAW